jgi:hypothetical protein
MTFTRLEQTMDPISSATNSTMSLWMRFVLAVLATWRVTHLLASEDGPADIIVRFRAILGPRLLGRLMDCFNCLSFWVAIPAALFVSRQLYPGIFAWLAISGAACLLERLARDPVIIEPAPPPTEGDANHVLRSETSGPAN